MSPRIRRLFIDLESRFQTAPQVAVKAGYAVKRRIWRPLLASTPILYLASIQSGVLYAHGRKER
jgi:hypothetical protein